MLGAVAEILRVRGSEGWLVGGSVRDRLLGNRSLDLDVVVADDPAEVAKLLATALRVPWFRLSERYPTFRVLGHSGHVDLTAVRGTGILSDLAERDFTVNAIAVPLAAVETGAGEVGGSDGLQDTSALIDPFEGYAHLREKRLVAVSDHIFRDDALRLMRAARFCHTLGLEPGAELVRMIKGQAGSLATTAIERVVNEMCITLAVGQAAVAVRLWDRLGLLRVVLPELTDPGGGSEARDRVDSTITASLDRLDEMLRDLGAWFPEHAESLRKRMAEAVDGAVTRPVALRLALLVRELGVDQARGLGRRLKLSGPLVSLLAASARCVGSGRRSTQSDPAHVLWGPAADPVGVGRKATLFLWDAAPWEPEVVLLATAVQQGASTDCDGSFRQGSRRLMDLAVKRAQGDMARSPIDGNDLILELGLERGPALGRALREARIAWECGEATTRADLLEVARRTVANG